MQDRAFDVVLYGASGFTGRQTVRYFAEHAPAGLRWAVAGRSRERLEALGAGVPVLVADAGRRSETDALARQTRVLLTTAGPFAVFGDDLVASCVEAGTHYVDITGEVAWVRGLVDRHHGKARAEGTKIIPFCGFDSVPADMGVHVLRAALGEGFCEARGYFQAGGGGPNGGTIASAISSYSSGDAERGRDLFLLSPGVARAVAEGERDPVRARFDAEVGAWVAPFPMSLIDTRVVRRSAQLLGQELRYQEYLLMGGAWTARAAAAGTAMFYGAMGSGFWRRVAGKVFRAGEGPTEAKMDGGWFRCRMLGWTEHGRRAEVVLSDVGDPANRVTVKCVCESALALACDEARLPNAAGVVTPSVGLGDVLVDRLRGAGMRIEVAG